MPGPSSFTSSMIESRSASCQVRTTSVPRPLAASIACSALIIEVEHDLLDLVRIGKHFGQTSGERLDHLNVGDALLVCAKPERFAQRLR